jgi:rhodanese-related sulfurtransferase
MYKGDIKPAEAYQRLQDRPNAWLVDVRTLPEWQFVGLPAVERLVRVSWQEYPAMQVNEDFVRLWKTPACRRMRRSCASAAPARGRRPPRRR